MERRLVLIPVKRVDLDAITGGTTLTDRVAYTATPELREALELPASAIDDVEHAALLLASVASLAQHGERLVLVAEVPGEDVLPGAVPADGECLVREVEPAAITCWFSEDPAVDASAAAAAAKDLDIDTAWEFEEVQQLLGSDLLWNDASEHRRTGS